MSLSVEPGELFGLLESNVAGKTTMTKILATILLPMGGLAQVMGMDVVKETTKIRPLIASLTHWLPLLVGRSAATFGDAIFSSALVLGVLVPSWSWIYLV